MTAAAQQVGIGFGLLGTTNTTAVSDAQAAAMFQAAWDLGVRRFDTAPLYGGGISEERLGHLLQGRQRAAYSLSTKVGRYRPYAAKVVNPKNNPRDWHDYSAEATKRSIEQSLTRLNTDRLDIVFVHDCDAHLPAALHECLPVLHDLKAQNVIGAIGCGSNVAATHEALLSQTDLDVLMVAGRFTLLDQSAYPQLLTLAQDKGVAIELAAPFNSGILATGASDLSQRFDYQAPPPDILDRVRQIEHICASFDVSIKRAALHYSRGHPAIKRLVLGLIHPDGLASNLHDLATPPPAALWDALAQIDIPHPITGPAL